MVREMVNRAEEKQRVLVTVEQQSVEGSLHQIASRLAECGLDDVETFQLGGVIAGEARTSDLATMRRVPGVASIETDQPFRAL
ncbi:MAG: hypothetical protein PGN12_09420 [Sphingomonas phyllosphaerae]